MHTPQAPLFALSRVQLGSALFAMLLSAAVGWWMGPRSLEISTAARPQGQPVVDPAALMTQALPALTDSLLPARQRLSRLAAMLSASGDGLSTSYRTLADALVRQPGAFPGLLESILEAWIKANPEEAIKWNESLPGSLQSADLLKSWMRADPTKAIHFLVSNGKARNAVNALRDLSDDDPAAAWKHFQELPDAIRKGHEWVQGKMRLRAEGVAGLKAMLDASESNRSVPWLFPESYESLMKADPQAVMESLEAHGKRADRPWNERPALQAWAKVDPVAAQAWIEANSPTDEMRALTIEGLSKKDPDAAWELAQTLSDDQALATAGTEKIRQLAKSDMPQAQEFALKAQNPELRRDLLKTLAEPQENETPAAARSRCEALLQSSQASALKGVEKLALLSPHLSPEEIQHFISQQPVKDQTEMLIAQASAGNSFQIDHPGATATMLAQAMQRLPAELWSPEMKDGKPVRSDEDTMMSVLSRSMAQWAGDNPAQASAFISQVPAGPVKESAITNLAINWFYADSSATTQWLEKQPSSDGRDRAITELFGEIAQAQPQQAAKLMASVTNAEAQAQLIKTLDSHLPPGVVPALREALIATPWTGQSATDLAKKLSGSK